MRLLRALRPALVRRGILTRQAFCQPSARAPALSFKRQYSDASEGPAAEKPDCSTWATIHPDGLEVKQFTKRTDMSRSIPTQVFPNLWLRDNCRCTQCVNQDTMQRTFDTFSLPQDIRVTEATGDESHAHVKWSDGHSSSYPWSFLRRGKHMTFGFTNASDVPLALWGSEIQNKAPSIGYRQVMDSEAGVAQLTMNIRKRGFSFVTDTPYDDPNDTKTLLERIAFIRQTHYGGFYDFKPDLAMADTAYTNVALAPHTDTTYFTEPAGLQAFHLLSHEPAAGEDAAIGGESLLVDGFKAAKMLAEEDITAARILSKVGIPWHASGNEGITIAPDKLYPVLEFHQGSLHRVRWNNDDRGVVPFGDITVEAWYEAARKWDRLLKSEKLQYWFQLKPGTVLIFDNWRVLHGRNSFKGIRRICGGYINRDDFVSRFRNTNFGRERSLEKVMR